jgi:tRNA threonylcarbamoyladenosine biosynthesis protein TsaB
VLILALDASTSTVAVALARERDDAREVLTEVSVAARGASEALLPAAHQALVLAGEDLDSVERILVGVGPGTFTGIRIAASTARSLSLATGAALSKNSTLAALAAPALLGFAGEHPDVLAIIDARRGQVFAQRFSKSGAVGGISCAVPLELPAGVGEPLLVGDGAVRYREQLSGLGRIPPNASPLHRVTAAGHALSADLAPIDAAEVVPLYVREPDAEVRRDRNPWIRP